ncbi:MAG: hypothetical protein R2708_14450 [Vicinamibacterales bacterium]
MTDLRAETPPHLLLAVAPDLHVRLHDTFTRAGFRVTAVAACRAILEACREPGPQAVIVDSELEGDQAARQAILELRARPWAAEVPVLLLIGPDDEAAVNHGREAGASDFATRLAPASLLKHRVQEMLRLAHGHRSQAQRVEPAQAQRIARLGNWSGADRGPRDVVGRVHLLGVPDGLRSATMAMFLSRVHRGDQAQAKAAIDQVLQGAASFALDLRFVQTGGHTRVLHTQGEAVSRRAGPSHAPHGHPAGHHRAHGRREPHPLPRLLDSLTNLPNRVLFTERLRHMLGTARRRNQWWRPSSSTSTTSRASTTPWATPRATSC